ncbi:MAG: hypothetical protein IJE78_04700 [Bacteroidaceae bacterium]|nr:hypothetical protein [Bacteroidaceae bacterium]
MDKKSEIEDMERNPFVRKMTEDEMQRQIALGYGWGKRIPAALDGVIRWLDNKDIVEFTNPRFTNTNVEFEINHDSNHKIWLSQLQYLFINDDIKGELYTGCLYLKDNTEKYLRSLSPEKFWNTVKGKKFQVFIDENARLLIDEKNEKVRTQFIIHNNWFKLVGFIFEKLEAKEYDSITGMTRQGRCYDLKEI